MSDRRGGSSEQKSPVLSGSLRPPTKGQKSQSGFGVDGLRGCLKSSRNSFDSSNPGQLVYEEAGSSVPLSMELGRFDSAIHRL